MKRWWNAWPVGMTDAEDTRLACIDALKEAMHLEDDSVVLDRLAPHQTLVQNKGKLSMTLVALSPLFLSHYEQPSQH